MILKYSFSFLLSFACLTAFCQSATSVMIEVQKPDQKKVEPYQQVHFTYYEANEQKLKSEQTLKWNADQNLWTNYSVWKKGISKEKSNSGIIVERYTTEGKKYTQKNANLEHTFMYRLSEKYFENFNSIYTRRPDGKILSVAYDRCRSNVQVNFKYNFDGSIASYEQISTGQYGDETIYRGSFEYPKVASPELDIQSVSAIDMEVYPNPSTGLVNIRFEKATDSDVKVFIESLSGEVLQKANFNNGTKVIPVDLSGYASGMYIVKCITGQQQILRKVFITQ